MGDLEGTSQDDPAAHEAFQRVVSSWEMRVEGARFPNGESLPEIADRFSEFTDGIPQKFSRVLVVGIVSPSLPLFGTCAITPVTGSDP